MKNWLLADLEIYLMVNCHRSYIWVEKKRPKTFSKSNFFEDKTHKSQWKDSSEGLSNKNEWVLSDFFKKKGKKRITETEIKRKWWEKDEKTTKLSASPNRIFYW